MENQKDLEKELDSFLTPATGETSDNATILTGDKAGLVERLDKKLVTADGRQLLTDSK